MDDQASPKLGIVQPQHGTDLWVASSGMTRRAQVDQADVDRTLKNFRIALAARLQEFMRVELDGVANKPVALQKICHVGKSTISRMLRPHASPYSYPKLDSLIKVCMGLKIDPIDLLMDAPTAKRWNRMQGQTRVPQEEPSQSLKSQRDR